MFLAINKIKKILSALLLLSFFSAVTYGSNNLLILLDEKDEEIGGSLNTLVNSFSAQLKYQESPMLVSVRTVKNFLENKIMFNKYNYISKDDIQNWSMYHCAGTQLLLFLPNTQPSLLLQKRNESVPNQPDKTIILRAINEENLKKIDLQNDQEPLVSLYNKIDHILVQGSISVEEIRGNPNVIQRLNIDNFKSFLFNDSDIKDQLISVLPDASATRLAELTSYFHSKLVPWNIILAGHGSNTSQVAGLYYEKLQRLLLLFNTMPINLLDIMSCYAGGQNINTFLLKNILPESKFINLHYIVVITSLNNSPARSILMSKGIVKKFFETLEENNENWLTKAIFSLSYQLSALRKNLIIENIPQVLIPHVGWFSVFLPTFGKTKDAENLYLSSAIKIINNITIQKYKLEPMLMQSYLTKIKDSGSKEQIAQLEEKIKTVKNFIPIPDKTEVLLLYPFHIPIPIKFETNNVPLIVSMEHSHDMYHHIDKIVLNNTDYLEFLQEAFNPRECTSRVRYFIDQIDGKKYNSDQISLLHNVLIDVKPSKYGFLSTGTIFFTKDDIQKKLVYSYWKDIRLNYQSEIVSIENISEDVFNEEKNRFWKQVDFYKKEGVIQDI